MTQAKNGDTVRVHYTGKLDDGTTFDTSIDRDPLEFTIGEGAIIAGFEETVIGMKPGESKTTTIPPEKGYGPHIEELVMKVDQDQLPPDLEAELGQQLQIKLADGQTMVVRVTEVSETSVTLDANHPLAGEVLTFEIKLVEIV